MRRSEASTTFPTPLRIWRALHNASPFRPIALLITTINSCAGRELVAVGWGEAPMKSASALAGALMTLVLISSAEPQQLPTCTVPSCEAAAQVCRDVQRRASEPMNCAAVLTDCKATGVWRGKFSTCRIDSAKSKGTPITVGADQIPTHCARWHAVCLRGCESNPGPGGVEACKAQTCGARNEECKRSGCYPFNIIGTKCLEPAKAGRYATWCPPGEITCEEWCRRYRPDPRQDCLTGSPRSCDRMARGKNSCVGNVPPR
jgi:hypothetical protein